MNKNSNKLYIFIIILSFIILIGLVILGKNKSDNKIEISDSNKKILSDSEKNCANKKDKKEKEDCENKFNLSNALLKNDTSYCKKISTISLQNDCINKVNENLYKLGLCSSISSITLKNSCLAKDKITKGGEITKKDCIMMSNLEDKKYCYDYFNYNEIIKSNNINELDEKKCEIINNITDKNNCKNMIVYKRNDIIRKEKLANLPESDIKGKCELTNTSGIDTNNCIKEEYTKKAMLNKNKSICDNISDSSGKTECLLKVGGMNDLDYFKEAKSKRDSSLCNNIKDALSKKQCIYLVSK